MRTPATPTLTEQLLRPDTAPEHLELARLLLAVQTAVARTAQLLARAPASAPAAGQLEAQCNQLWLEQLVRSGAVQLVATRSAASVLEVEPEQQGGLLLALDPLSRGPACGLATSSFSVWTSAGTGAGAGAWPGGGLVCGGVAVYGAATQLTLAAGGGVTCYRLEPGLGQLVAEPGPAPRPAPALASLPASAPDSELAAAVRRHLAHCRPGAGAGLRTGLAAVDSLAVIRGGGAWLSDPALALLYHATPLAFIGNTYWEHTFITLHYHNLSLQPQSSTARCIRTSSSCSRTRFTTPWR